ncbi:hypothetical protein ACFO0N_02485 [Halobium salinum]|uniref:Uncharacterized protein n=1 Tax=Halobium salinum TaxID=1364940 RepID=A0ABD5P7F7_9EURY|nr:hypothetical protein [Halobium salinum]
MDSSSTHGGRGTVFLCLLLVLGSGCLTVGPTVGSDAADSPVFEGVSTTDEWGTNSVQVSLRLTPTATTDSGVTKLSVVSPDGGSFYSTTVDAGQQSVSLPLPTGESRIYAVNTVNGTVVGTLNVTVEGSTYP